MAEPDRQLVDDRAPAPDDPRKPQGPTEVHKRSWSYTLRRTFAEFTSDQCTDIAASLTYFAVLAVFPGIVALVSLLALIGQGEGTLETLVELIRSFAPTDAAKTIEAVLDTLTQAPAAGIGLVAGLIGALFSASGYVGAFMRASNRIYEVPEGRTIIQQRLTQLGVTITTLVLIVIVGVLLTISGPVTEALGQVLGLGETFVVIWSIARWPVLALAVVLMIAVLYHFAPNVKQPRFRWTSLGAMLAVLTLVLTSVGFGFYVVNFGNYDRVYGSLGGIIVFLLWLWISNLALLFGAELDAELERSRQLQAGIEAEETLQLPLRNSAGANAKLSKEAALELEGHAIRKGVHRVVIKNGKQKVK